MFKCCVCNKSSKKERPNGEVTKSTPRQSQRVVEPQSVTVDSSMSKGNGPIEREEKLNGDVQRFDKVSSTMENSVAEVVDDLTVKSPLPSGKRDEVNDSSRSRAESIIKSEDKEGGMDEGDGEYDKEKVNGGNNAEVNGVKGANGKAEVDGIDSISGSGDEDGDGGMMEAILNSGVPSTVKTNLYDSPAYIERTIDDGPEEEGDDSVFEACPNDISASKKTPPGIFLSMRGIISPLRTHTCNFLTRPWPISRYVFSFILSLSMFHYIRTTRLIAIICIRIRIL